MTNKSLKIQYSISFVLLISAIFFYVFQVSALTKEKYLIEKYQEQIQSFYSESQSLEYQFLQNNSFFEIDNIARQFDFERVVNVSYIEVLGTEVVVR